MKQQLDVGDILYSHHKYGKGINRHIVTRVTNKQAILDNSSTKIKREVCGHTSHGKRLYCNEIGGYGNYYLETDEFKQKYEWWVINRKTDRLLETIDLSKLTTTELTSLYHHLLTLKPKEQTS